MRSSRRSCDNWPRKIGSKVTTCRKWSVDIVSARSEAKLLEYRNGQCRIAAFRDPNGSLTPCANRTFRPISLSPRCPKRGFHAQFGCAKRLTPSLPFVVAVLYTCKRSGCRGSRAWRQATRRSICKMPRACLGAKRSTGILTTSRFPERAGSITSCFESSESGNGFPRPCWLCWAR